MTTSGPPAAAAKKGVHPLVWVGLGCGVLMIVAFVAVVGAGMFFGKKAMEFAEEMEENPVLTAAKIYAGLNPEVEVVSADDEKQIVTLRNVSTGEELTVDLEDLKEGRIRFSSAEGEVNLEFEEGKEGGSLTVTSDQGTATFGAAQQADLPDWIPVYPGAQAESTFAVDTDEESSGVFTVTSEDSYSELADFYRQELEDAGFEVQVQSTRGVVSSSVVIATHDEKGQTVNVAASPKDDKAVAIITYNRKK